MRLPLAMALIVGLAMPAWGQVETISARPDRTTLVIYRFHPIDTSRSLESLRNGDRYAGRDGLAMIVETRTIDVPAGDAVIRFEGLTTGIIPETAAIDGLPGEVLERNGAFEVLGPGSLLQHSIGEMVQVVRTNPETGVETTVPAIVRSGANGPMLEIDGRLEPLSCQGLNQRLIFDRVPDGLSDRPTLSIRTRSPVVGRYTVRLAYLTEGLKWSADYVARLAPDGSSMDIEGWITLMNFTGGSFTNAPVQVVAGNLARDYATEAIEPVSPNVIPRCWPMDTTTRNGLGERGGTMSPSPVVDYLATMPASSNGLVGEANEIDEVVVTGSRIRAVLSELGDYKVYTLAEPTDLNARQAKQLRFFNQRDVRFTRTYQLHAYHDEVEPQVPHLLLRLRNEAEDGLGLPMPGGGLSLVETQDGATVLTGQAEFMDRGEGVPLELQFGQAMGLAAEIEVTNEDDWQVGDVHMQKAAVEMVLTNDKDWPVEIEIVPEWSGRRGFRVLEQSRLSVVNEAGDTVWRVRVPAHGSESLSYTIQSED